MGKRPKTDGLKPRLVSQAEGFRKKRQSFASGSFMDARVYRQALMCQAPDSDPCEANDCSEDSAVLNPDGSGTEGGSADQTSSDGGGQYFFNSASQSKRLTARKIQSVAL